jgi:hypothetical protein
MDSVTSVGHDRKHAARICMFVFVSSSPCLGKSDGIVEGQTDQVCLLLTTFQ